SIGIPTFSAYTLHYVSALNSIFLLNADGFYRLSASDFSVIAFKDYPPNYRERILGISANGEHAYIASDDKIHRLNTTTLEYEKSYEVKNLTNFDAYINEYLEISIS